MLKKLFACSILVLLMTNLIGMEQGRGTKNKIGTADIITEPKKTKTDFSLLLFLPREILFQIVQDLLQTSETPEIMGRSLSRLAKTCKSLKSLVYDDCSKNGGLKTFIFKQVPFLIDKYFNDAFPSDSFRPFVCNINPGELLKESNLLKILQGIQKKHLDYLLLDCCQEEGKITVDLKLDSNKFLKELIAKFGKHCDFNVQNSESGITPLIFVLSQDDLADNERNELLDMILQSPKLDINIKDFEGRTALMCQAWKNDNIGLLLKKSEIDVNCQDKYGYTALMMMLKAQGDYAWYADNDVKNLKSLLEHPKVDLKITTCKGKNILMFACKYKGFGPIASKILELDPELDINATNARGESALDYAISSGDHDILKILLENPKINVNCADADGCTPLIAAASKGFDKSVELLLGVPGINYNAKDSDGDTALIAACNILVMTGDNPSLRECFKRIIELLLCQPGVDLDDTNKQGNSARSLLKRANDFDCDSFILKYDLKNNNNNNSKSEVIEQPEIYSCNICGDKCEQSDMQIAQCGHKFHKDCLSWLANECPECKK